MERDNIYEKLCPYVERAKGRDEQAFEYLYHHTHEMMRVFVSNFCIIRLKLKTSCRRSIWRSSVFFLC